jgi:hypothetical protein
MNIPPQPNNANADARVPRHVPKHTRVDAEQPAVGKIQGRWMNPPSRGSEPSRPVIISLYDDEDFFAVHLRPSCAVVCPLDGCGTRLTAKTNNRTRWFAARRGSISCDHNLVPLSPPTSRGGLETDEHRWMKARIARVCIVNGYDAFIEHQPTHADVFLPDSKIAIEYQRWDTEFDKRNLERSHAGAETTLWFFPEFPRQGQKEADNALVDLFKSRVRLHGGIFITPAHSSKRQKGRLIVQEPWRNPEDREMSRTTRLFVSGSIVTYDSTNKGLKHTGSYGLHHFLGEVVRGERTLQHADVRIQNHGVVRKLVWVLTSDLDKIAASKREAAEQIKATEEREKDIAKRRTQRAVAVREATDSDAEWRSDEPHAFASMQPICIPEGTSPLVLTEPERPASEEMKADDPTRVSRRRSLWERVKTVLRER